MSLLKGTSAFSFKPGGGVGDTTATEPQDLLPDRLEDDDAFDDDDEMRKRSLEEKSPGEDFGGDYGDYLKLLQGDSALGYNPQPDPIGDNQVYDV